MGAKAWGLLEALSQYLPTLAALELPEDARRRQAFETLLKEVAALIRSHTGGKLTTAERGGALVISHADAPIVALRVANGSLEMQALYDAGARFESVPDLGYDQQNCRVCAPPQRNGEWSTDAVDSVVIAIDKAVRAWKDGS